MTKTAAGGTPRTPEFQILQALRQDLFVNAFVYRPLPPMRTDGPLTRRLPEGIRLLAPHAPHAAVGLAAFVVVVLGGMDGWGMWFSNPLSSLFMGLIAGVPVLMTLMRPIAAFWASVASTLLLSVFDAGYMTWPWSPSSFLAYLTVLAVVAMRTGPRVSAWMWAITVGLGAVMVSLLGRGQPLNVVNMMVVSAFVLLAISMRHIRVEAVQEVTAQQEVTAVERDRRTLLEERTTIARELHDVVAHHMSVVAIQAEAAPYRVENPPPELEAAFATIRENAVAALTELRRVLGVVRSADYEAPEAPQPTLAALDGLLANVREAGLSVEKTVTGSVRELPQGVELSAYRIIQEALSNTLRHAPGAAAGVEVSYVLGGLGVRVVNDPPSGDVRPSSGAGHGITGMRERVAMLEGEMTAGETAEGGYEVAVFIPVRSVPVEDAA
ncbi:sensor histidine kinase [Streptomyces venezuelae]|uniref:sensor histidine kinase n=1 Tax=Streptomyces venezuelae TaxID=54571 RepID=UPI001CC222EB|nr:histidine kinase [Streptomyces venezuelae]